MKSGRQPEAKQEVSQGVDDAMRCLLRAGAKMEDGKQLRTGTMTSETQSTWVEQCSLVRNSSNCRWVLL